MIFNQQNLNHKSLNITMHLYLFCHPTLFNEIENFTISAQFCSSPQRNFVFEAAVLSKMKRRDEFAQFLHVLESSSDRFSPTTIRDWIRYGTSVGYTVSSRSTTNANKTTEKKVQNFANDSKEWQLSVYTWFSTIHQSKLCNEKLASITIGMIKLSAWWNSIHTFFFALANKSCNIETHPPTQSQCSLRPQRSLDDFS